jgi:arylsulfatase A-like enzyme
MDVLPTACAAAGVRPTATTMVDGVDLVPFLRGDREEAPHGDLFWKIKSAAALRRGDWKLLMLAPEFRPQLFHLGRDVGEARDLAGEEPALTRELLDAWQAWNRTMPPPARPTPAAAKKS